MKLLLMMSLFFFSSGEWQHNLEDAKKIAGTDHKYILLNFSGSDWCGPCIRMQKEIFETDVFKKMADTELILVNADFPRNKKNQPSVSQQKSNDEMADLYNRKGIFPYTLLLDSQGKVLKTWEGFPDESAESFTLDIRNEMYTIKNTR
ncbi:MAG TPA: thioredoxin family protein [Puia sp.]|nr:thioredoxin family protein [Puia sp.]